MSRLYHTEEGRAIPSLCEELTRFRRACKPRAAGHRGAGDSRWFDDPPAGFPG